VTCLQASKKNKRAKALSSDDEDDEEDEEKAREEMKGFIAVSEIKSRSIFQGPMLRTLLFSSNYFSFITCGRQKWHLSLNSMCEWN
jgi:hypothetical protein